MDQPCFIMQLFTAGGVRRGEAQATSRPLEGYGFRAVSIEIRDLEIQIPASERHILVVSLGLRPKIHTDLLGSKMTSSFPTGSFVFIPAGQPSWWSTVETTSQVLHVHMSPALFKEVAGGKVGPCDPRPILAETDGLINQLQATITGELQGGHSAPRIFRDSLGILLAHRLARLTETNSSPQGRTAGRLAPWQIERAKTLLADQLCEDVSLLDLSSELRLSQFHFARAFKASTGVPPHRYQILLRIERARQLLETTITPVIEIGAAVGYQDPGYFSRLFSREVGVPPSVYRRERRGSRMMDTDDRDYRALR